MSAFNLLVHWLLYMANLIVMNSMALTYVKTSHNDMQTYSFKAEPMRQGIKPGLRCLLVEYLYQAL